MVLNCGKGGSGHKKMKKSGFVVPNRELYFKEHGQDYAIITSMLGHDRCRCKLAEDNREVLGIIRGSMRKKYAYHVNKNDIVLVGLRDFQDSKVDIMHLYNSDEVKMLINYNEITVAFVNNQNPTTHQENESDNDDIVFSDI